MNPVLGRKVIECQQLVLVLSDGVASGLVLRLYFSRKASNACSASTFVSTCQISWIADFVLAWKFLGRLLRTLMGFSGKWHKGEPDIAYSATAA